MHSLQRVSMARRCGEMFDMSPTVGKGSCATEAGETAHSSRPDSRGKTTFSGCGLRSMCPDTFDSATITFSRIV